MATATTAELIRELNEKWTLLHEYLASPEHRRNMAALNALFSFMTRAPSTPESQEAKK